MYFDYSKRDTCTHEELTPWLDRVRKGHRFEIWKCVVCGTAFWKGPEALNNVVPFPTQNTSRGEK